MDRSILENEFENSVMQKELEDLNELETILGRNIVEVLLKHVSYASMRGEVIYCPHVELEHSPLKKHGMNRAFLKGPYKSVRQKVISSKKCELSFIESSEQRPTSFVEFVQGFLTRLQ